MNQRQDQLSGGKERMALPLNAASVTTRAGSTRKPRMATTTAPPTKRNGSERDISVRAQAFVGAKPFKRPRRRAHQCEEREGEHERGDRQARRKGKVEAC